MSQRPTKDEGRPTKDEGQRQPWQEPRIVMERSLVAKAQDPFLGEVDKEKADPFLGPLSASL